MDITKFHLVTSWITDFRPTRVGNHPATVLETFGCWPRFWVCLNLFDLSDVVNITCIVHYGIEINIHTYIHTYFTAMTEALSACRVQIRAHENQSAHSRQEARNAAYLWDEEATRLRRELDEARS